MIELQAVSKHYKTTKALDQVTYRIPKGKLTVILGENGSGKTTLLKILAKQIDITLGQAYLDRCELDSYSRNQFAQKVSVLNQINQEASAITVWEFVSYGRYPYSKNKLTPNDHEIINRAMAYVDCLEYKDKVLNELSGGQIQRVYIALLLTQDTEVILLDEPLNHLDLKHAHDLMKLLKKLTSELNKTLVVVLHDLNMCLEYGDEVIAFKEGNVVCQGPLPQTLSTDNLKEIYDMNFELIRHKKTTYVVVEKDNK